MNKLNKTVPASSFKPKGDAFNNKRIENDYRVKIWKTIRGPFVLPQNLKGHKCTEWEIFDMDVAGCLTCGNIHHCRDENTCTLSEENDGRICIITGCCVKQKVYSMDEFMDNIMIDEEAMATSSSSKDFFNHIMSQSSTKDQVYKLEEVNKCIRWVMVSNICKDSYENEKNRMTMKHRQVIWKLLKDFKINNPKKVPKLCNIVAKMLHQCNKIRICCPEWDESIRKTVADHASEYITRFLNMLSQKFKLQLSMFKNNILFIGIVYLMRMGITMHNVILLPKIHELQYLLPIEAHLKCYFKIKCKFITEVENLIKMCIRNLTNKEIEMMGFTSVDIKY